MKNTLIPAIAMAIALAHLTSCSKSDVTMQSPQAPPVVVPQQSTAQRIAEIEVLLAVPPTGTVADANRRAALRAERDALSGGTYSARERAAFQQRLSLVAQDSREHQQMISQVKAESDRSRLAEQRQLQAQRDQWDKEDRLMLRRQNGNFHPEAPPQNTYDIQVQQNRDLRQGYPTPP